MPLSQFLNDLFEHGNVRLSKNSLSTTEGAQAKDDLNGVAEVLAERERVVAAEFPGVAPTLDIAAAIWAARQFHAACYFVLFRTATIEAVRARLASPPPSGEPASLHYSIDLAWRFLPDLDRLTATLAPHDPLREVIRDWGAERPLSSVGMKGIEPRREDELLTHGGLRQAYVDRIIQVRDSARLRNPVVRELAIAALGQKRAAAANWISELAITTAGSPPTKSPEL